MTRKKKGELPSGSIRRQIYNGMKQKTNKDGKPIFKPDGSPWMIRDYISVTADSSKEAEVEKASVLLNKKGKKKKLDITLSVAIDKYIQSSDTLLSVTTISGYRNIQRNGFQTLLNMKLSGITYDVLKEAVNAESRQITRRGKVISPKTVSNRYGLPPAGFLLSA